MNADAWICICMRADFCDILNLLCVCSSVYNMLHSIVVKKSQKKYLNITIKTRRIKRLGLTENIVMQGNRFLNSPKYDFGPTLIRPPKLDRNKLHVAYTNNNMTGKVLLTIYFYTQSIYAYVYCKNMHIFDMISAQCISKRNKKYLAHDARLEKQIENHIKLIQLNVTYDWSIICADPQLIKIIQNI